MPIVVLAESFEGLPDHLRNTLVLRSDLGRKTDLFQRLLPPPHACVDEGQVSMRCRIGTIGPDELGESLASFVVPTSLEVADGETEESIQMFGLIREVLTKLGNRMLPQPP